MYIWRAMCAAEKLVAETQMQQWFQGNHFLEASSIVTDNVAILFLWMMIARIPACYYPQQ